jgi:hypothetical protein
MAYNPSVAGNFKPNVLDKNPSRRGGKASALASEQVTSFLSCCPSPILFSVK